MTFEVCFLIFKNVYKKLNSSQKIGKMPFWWIKHSFYRLYFDDISLSSAIFVKNLYDSQTIYFLLNLYLISDRFPSLDGSAVMAFVHRFLWSWKKGRFGVSIRSSTSFLILPSSGVTTSPSSTSTYRKECFRGPNPTVSSVGLPPTRQILLEIFSIDTSPAISPLSCS